MVKVKQEALSGASWDTMLYQMPLFFKQNYDVIVKNCDRWIAGVIQFREATRQQALNASTNDMAGTG